MTDTDNIVRKIKALLTTAEGTDNVHEAEVFMAKVNELLERHQIEMHQVRAAGADADPMTTIDEFVTRSHEWPTRVGSALADYYGCKMLRWSMGSRYLIKVMGRQSACMTFQVMYPFILSQVRQQARQFARDYRISLAKAERSVGIALQERIYRLVPQVEQRRSDMTANALVPVTDVKAYVESLYPSTKTARKVQGHYREAEQYADRVSLNHQATAVGRKQIAAQ